MSFAQYSVMITTLEANSLLKCFFYVTSTCREPWYMTVLPRIWNEERRIVSTEGGAFLLQLQLNFALTLNDCFHSDTFKVNLNEEAVWSVDSLEFKLQVGRRCSRRNNQQNQLQFFKLFRKNYVFFVGQNSFTPEFVAKLTNKCSNYK